MKKSILILLLLGLVASIVYLRLQPLRTLNRKHIYTGSTNVMQSNFLFDKRKKTVVIMADNNMTELFDLLAPFYLFSETGQANVYIAAQKRYPVVTKNGPLLMPHFSYAEMDSLNIHPDVIVIPYMDAPESITKTAWLKNHYSDSLIVLSVCDGAWTAAASGLYDGKPLTSHATGHQKLKERFSGPRWVQNIRFTQSGNLFSTGGISNAADGSLAVIEKLFGHETMLKVLRTVHFPQDNLQTQHASTALNTSGKMTALMKMLFKENKHIGVLLQDSVNELELAAVYDVYNRSLPLSVQTILPNGQPVRSCHGLCLFTDDKVVPAKIEELHLLSPATFSKEQLGIFKNAKPVAYDNLSYIVDACLAKVKEDYGPKFQQYVKTTMDYN
jgi:transcriptional regulator GlxA family with amidase domain